MHTYCPLQELLEFLLVFFLFCERTRSARVEMIGADFGLRALTKSVALVVRRGRALAPNRGKLEVRCGRRSSKSTVVDVSVNSTPSLAKYNPVILLFFEELEFLVKRDVPRCRMVG